MPQLPYALIELTCAKPVTKPLSDDPLGTLDIEMTIIHNVLIRGINSMWTNSVLVKPGDEQGFAGYCLAGTLAIHGHHTVEEEVMFPFLQTKLDMARNIEQHEAFHDALTAFEQHMKHVQCREVTYNGKEVRALIEAFGEPLVQHLHDEIPTISPERMKAFENDVEGLKAMLQDLDKHVRNEEGALVVIPFLMSNLDAQEATNWPPISRPVKWIVRNLLPWLNHSYWKFAPFTPNGVPQTYA